MSGSANGGWAASRFLAPYYVSSALLTAPVYLALRWWFLARSDLSHARIFSGDELWEKERLALLMMAIPVGAKFWRRTSWDAFLSDAALFGKAAVGLLAWFIDWRMCLLYGLAVAVAYLLFPQPLFRGPSAVEHLTPAAFKARVEDAPPGETWLVEFYAPWSPPCIHLEPVVAELSLQYRQAKALKWGKVDASRWPALAEQHKVAVYGAEGTLPAFIMFEKGKELGRIPHLYPDGSVSNIRIRRQDIVTAFGLDEFLDGTAARAAAAAAAPRSGSAKKRR